MGWDELKAGDVTKAEGLVALDDHTLQITLTHRWPPGPRT